MIPNYFRNMVYAVTLFLCAASYGEELPDLIARLQKMEGNETIRAVVHIEDRTPRAETKGSQQIENVDLTIAADTNTLTLTVSGEISDTTIFREFSLFRAGELVHYGLTLARKLTGLELVGRLPDLYEGISCIRWRLRSEEKQSRFGASSSKRQDVELWIDADGYPVAALFKIQGKGKILFFKQSRKYTYEQRYKRLGGRLILVFDKIDETERQGKSERIKRITTTVELKKD